MPSQDKCPSCFRRYATNDLVPRLLECGHTVCSYCLDKLLEHSASSPSKQGKEKDGIYSSRGGGCCPVCGHSMRSEKDSTASEFPVSMQVVKWLGRVPKKSKKLFQDTEKFTVSEFLYSCHAAELPKQLENKMSDLSNLLEDAENLLSTMRSDSLRIRTKIKEQRRSERRIKSGLSTIRTLEDNLRCPTSSTDLAHTVQDISDSAAHQDQLLLSCSNPGKGREEAYLDPDEVRSLIADTRGCYAVFRYPPEPATPSSDSNKTADAATNTGDNGNNGGSSGSASTSDGESTPSSGDGRSSRNNPGEGGATVTAFNTARGNGNGTDNDLSNNIEGIANSNVSSSGAATEARPLVEEQECDDDDSDEEEEEPKEECFYSKLTLDGRYLLMHALRKLDKKPEDLVEEFVHSDLMMTVKVSQTLVFLDLNLGRLDKLLPHGRVVIRIVDDTVLAQHFVAMCAGQCKANYIGTKLIIADRDTNGERLDAVFPATMTNTQIVYNASVQSVTEDIVTGLVAGKSGHSSGEVPTSLSFSIYLRDWANYENVNSIGQVISGMSILRGAIKKKEAVQKSLYISDTAVLLNQI